MLKYVFVLLYINLCVLKIECVYTVPDPEIVVYSPRGLKVSIPDFPGIQLFAFHGNVNKDMGHLEAGQMSKDVIKKMNNRWVFEDKKIRIKKGDVITYWLFVIKDDLGFRCDNGRYDVQELAVRPLTILKEPSKNNSRPLLSQMRPKPDSQTEGPLQSLLSTNNDNSGEHIHICHESLLKVTKTLNDANAKLARLTHTNEVILQLLETYNIGNKLVANGSLAQEDDEITTIRFILKEKIQLPVKVVGAERQEDGSIIFELKSLHDKLTVLENADKAFNNTRIQIKNYIPPKQ